ncbi:MAG: cobalamin-independent methionine synthase II family protein [Chloroflexota bacterium]
MSALDAVNPANAGSGPYDPAPLATSVIGSHARPGWLEVAVAAAGRGELGPVDIREVMDDAVDLALRDQADAGIDIVSDGEMRRAGFFTAEFYRHLTGVEPLPSDRRLGASGHDQQHRFKVLEPIASPDGLGVVEEFQYARTRTDRPIKVTLPGPFTLSGRLTYGAGQVYPDRIAVAEAFVPILAAEVGRLADAGATYIQIDEPSPAIHPEASDRFADLFNASVAGVKGRVRLAAHLCFGNFLGRPLARRQYRPVLEQALRFDVAELVLEWANREMAELDVACDIAAAGRDVGAGVIDVKSYHLESADEVAERIGALLDAGVPADRLLLVPDCGFSQTARWATKPKLRALVEGRDLVLGRASGAR